MDSRNKNKRLCDILRSRNESCCGQKKVVSAKRKKSSSKTKTKKSSQNTFSMIKFYESIPNYDDIRDLPECDFTERLRLLKRIHCDLSQPLVQRCDSQKSTRPCSGKTSATKKCKRIPSATKQNAISPSLCRTFSKTSLNDVEECPSAKRNPPDKLERCPSADSMSLSLPLRRLQLLRERIESFTDHEFKDEKQKNISTMRSPTFSEIKLEHSPHFHHHIESHPCELYFNQCHSSLGMQPLFSPSFREVSSPSKRMKNCEPDNSDLKRCSTMRAKSPPMEPIRRRRAQSCPKEIYVRPSNDVLIPQSVPTRQSFQETPTSLSRSSVCISTASLRHRSKPKSVPKPKSKTPPNFDEYLSSKIVRGNLTANLRHKWSRKKINDMAEEKMKETLPVSNFIPKCHKWNIRNTPAWKTFAAEDTQQEQRLREEARREEEKLRQHAHTMNMNIMRSRVKTAQLLLEGRSLSAKA